MDQVNKNPGGGETNELEPGDLTQGSTGALDPHETWGQGPDLSHPDSAMEDVTGGPTPSAPDEDSSISKQPYAP